MFYQTDLNVIIYSHGDNLRVVIINLIGLRHWT